jgi:hypothetical protein
VPSGRSATSGSPPNAHPCPAGSGSSKVPRVRPSAKHLLPLLLAAAVACTVERPPEPNTNPVVLFRDESGYDFGDCGVLRYTTEVRCPAELETLLACIDGARATCTPTHWVVERSAGGFASVDHFFLVPVEDTGACGIVSFDDTEESGCKVYVRRDCLDLVVPGSCSPPTPRDCGEPIYLGASACVPEED